MRVIDLATDVTTLLQERHETQGFAKEPFGDLGRYHPVFRSLKGENAEAG